MAKTIAPTPVAVEEASPKTRSVHIELADNAYVVRICDSNYKEIELVFTSQASMIRTVKEATTIGGQEEK